MIPITSGTQSCWVIRSDMIWSDLFVYFVLFAGSICIYLPIYRYLVARWSADYVVRAVESGEIDLTYLLEEGGVFDELAARVVTRFKHNALAELGQLSHQSGSAEQIAADPAAMGIEAAGQLLNMVGMKKPPAMLQYKVAEALGKMVAQQQPVDEFEQFRP